MAISKPIIIDTDTGVDDALALILALRSPELDVKAVTTVAGNVEVRKCTQNVLRVLDWLNVDGVIVAQGASKPMRGNLFTAPEVHGKDGLGNLSLPKPNRKSVRESAVRIILDLCRTYGKQLTIVAIGPLTNLAHAFQTNPSLFRRVGKIITMGGAFHVPGNTGPVAEFNYYVDPDAAHIILNSGLPVTVISLDATQQLVLMRKELEYRAARRASRVANMIARFTRSYMHYHRKHEGFEGGYLHDPLAVAAAIDPTVVKTTSVHVDVEKEGKFTRGMTVAEFRHSSRNDRKVDVALRVNREQFFKLFHERLWK